MIVVENITGNILGADLSGLKTDCVLLKHDELVKVHRKLTTEAGNTIAISLPAGAVLNDGDVLYREDDNIIFVSLAEEKIIAVRPQGHIQWAKVAYNIGNLHQTAYLQEDGLYVPYDESIFRIIEKLNMDYKIYIGKLNGEVANVNISNNSQVNCHKHD